MFETRILQNLNFGNYKFNEFLRTHTNTFQNAADTPHIERVSNK